MHISSRSPSFHDSRVADTAVAVLVLMLILNFYSLVSGNLLALIPLALQSSFLILFGHGHRWYRPVGLVLFGLLAVGGTLGLLAIGMNGLLAMAAPAQASAGQLTLTNIGYKLSAAVFGSFMFYALVQTSPPRSGTLRLRLRGWKQAGFGRACRNAFVLRVGLVILFFAFGVALGLTGRAHWASDYSMLINFSEHLLLVAGLVAGTVHARGNLFTHALLFSVMSWVFLLPFSLGSPGTWLLGLYVFLVEAVIGAALLSVYYRYRPPQLLLPARRD